MLKYHSLIKHSRILEELTFYPLIKWIASKCKINIRLVVIALFLIPFLSNWFTFGFLEAVNTFCFLSGIYFSLRTVILMFNLTKFAKLSRNSTQIDNFSLVTIGIVGPMLLAIVPYF